MSKELDRKKLDELVDIVLDYNKTPRRHLFEYPYRADESKQLIKNAEHVVFRIKKILDSE